MAITTASQSQLGQDTAKNSQIVTTSVRLINSGASTGPAITSVIVTDSGYNNLDDTAAATSNSYIRILGTGFQSTANVFLNGTMVPKANVTFVSSSELRAVLPVSNTGNYALGVFNSNSAGALYSSSFVISTMPQWLTSATLSDQASGTAFNVNLSATSDSSVTYANTTALPAGTSLAANGLFSGTITTGVQTTYTFDVKATDAENQDNTRTFSVTVIVGPPPGLYSWGSNQFNTLGLNVDSSTVYARSSPTQVGTETNWNTFGSGRHSIFAIKTDGTLWSWGWGFSGQLGQNSTNNPASPVQVGTNTNWSFVNPSGSIVMSAVKTNGTLWTWGYNASNQFLGGLTSYRSSPTQIGSGTDWLRTYTAYNSFGIKTNGTLWNWGNSVGGSSGRNTTTGSSTLLQVGSNTNWLKIANMGGTVLALKTDGTLWAWGNGGQGLGLNNLTARSSPTQVGSGTDWADIGGNNNSSYAIKTNGTLWSWGENNYGQLGQNNIVSRSSPVQVGSGTSWSKIIPGSENVYCIVVTKTDGTIWSWGYNGHGQLGLNDTVDRSSPVQIGSTTNWNTINGVLTDRTTVMEIN